MADAPLHAVLMVLRKVRHWKRERAHIAIMQATLVARRRNAKHTVAAARFVSAVKCHEVRPSEKAHEGARHALTQRGADAPDRSDGALKQACAVLWPPHEADKARQPLVLGKACRGIRRVELAQQRGGGWNAGVWLHLLLNTMAGWNGGVWLHLLLNTMVHHGRLERRRVAASPPERQDRCNSARTMGTSNANGCHARKHTIQNKSAHRAGENSVQLHTRARSRATRELAAAWRTREMRSSDCLSSATVASVSSSPVSASESV